MYRDTTGQGTQLPTQTDFLGEDVMHKYLIYCLDLGKLSVEDPSNLSALFMLTKVSVAICLYSVYIDRSCLVFESRWLKYAECSIKLYFSENIEIFNNLGDFEWKWKKKDIQSK